MCCKGKCKWWMIVKILVIIGAINWGLIGLGMIFGARNWNVVGWIFGSISPIIEAIVYILVGVAGVMKIFGCKCKKCAVGAPTETPKMM